MENKEQLKRLKDIEEREKCYRKLPPTEDAVTRNQLLIKDCSKVFREITHLQKSKRAESITEHKTCVHEYNKMVALEYQKWRKDLKGFRNMNLKQK